MKILNLYAWIWWNRKLWWDTHEVTAVEYKQEIANVYKDLFPNDNVIVWDAHEYLLKHYKEFDFIRASPPCPTHSRVRFWLWVGSWKVEPVYPDMTLYQEIVLLSTHFKGKRCVENVIAYYKPLINPQVVWRHRYRSNFDITKVEVAPSRISMQSKAYSKSPVRIFWVADYEKLYDYNLAPYKWIDKRLALRNCVEPEIWKHILECALFN